MKKEAILAGYEYEGRSGKPRIVVELSGRTAYKHQADTDLVTYTAPGIPTPKCMTRSSFASWAVKCLGPAGRHN